MSCRCNYGGAANAIMRKRFRTLVSITEKGREHVFVRERECLKWKFDLLAGKDDQVARHTRVQPCNQVQFLNHCY